MKSNNKSNLKRGSSISQLVDSDEGEEFATRRRKTKRPKAPSSQAEDDSTIEPFGTSSRVIILQAAFASILETQTPSKNAQQVSSVESSVSGEESSTSRLSECSRCSPSTSYKVTSSTMGTKRDIHMILEASALLNNHGTLRHPLAPSCLPMTPALNKRNGSRLVLPIGKPLHAPPRLPQLTPGQYVQRRTIDNSFSNQKG